MTTQTTELEAAEAALEAGQDAARQAQADATAAAEAEAEAESRATASGADDDLDLVVRTATAARLARKRQAEASAALPSLQRARSAAALAEIEESWSAERPEHVGEIHDLCNQIGAIAAQVADLSRDLDNRSGEVLHQASGLGFQPPAGPVRLGGQPVAETRYAAAAAVLDAIYPAVLALTGQGAAQHIKAAVIAAPELI